MRLRCLNIDYSQIVLLHIGWEGNQVLKRAPKVPHEVQLVRTLVLQPVHHLLLLHPLILNLFDCGLTNAF